MHESGTDIQPRSFPAMSIAEAHRRLTAPGARFEMEERTIRGVPLRVWKNAPPTLRDVFLNARAFGARECLVYEDDRASYEAFARAALTFSHELVRVGVHKGDRVAIAMRNLPEWPVALFGALLCGAIVAPCNAWGSAAELRHVLLDCAPKILVADGERLDRLLPELASCPSLERVYVARSVAANAALPVVALADTIGAVACWHELPNLPLPEVALEPEDDAAIFYTSGTTGKAKGAVATHRNGCSNTLTTACAQARAFLRRGEEPPSPQPGAPQRVMLLATPLFHVMGCMPWLVAGLNQGNKFVLMRKWDAEQALGLIERERVTQAGGVPTMALSLASQPSVDRYDLSSLESISYGGAPASPELVRKLREVFPRARPSNGWGMTEVTSSFAANTGEDYLARPESCGVAAPTNDWKIMSEDGARELPAGAVGELWVRGPQVVRGYWNDPQSTTESFLDGWLKTGDVARIDAEGFCTIVDRSKDMLIRGGENIYCVEVENALQEHPAVHDVAVFGVGHPTLGEEPAAVVQLAPGAALSLAELVHFGESRLASFKVPRLVAFTDEPLPRNAAGKLLKRELKARFAANKRT
jgi:long-chain acyl-CoA synthetase